MIYNYNTDMSTDFTPTRHRMPRFDAYGKEIYNPITITDNVENILTKNIRNQYKYNRNTRKLATKERKTKYNARIGAIT